MSASDPIPVTTPRAVMDPRMAYGRPAIEEIAGLPVLVPAPRVRHLLGITAKTLRGLRKRGDLMPPWPRDGEPASRGRVYISRDSLVAFLRRKGVRC